MSLKTIANQKACAGATGANTGKLGCLSLFGSVEHALPIPRGTKYPGSTVFNLAFITAEVEAGRMNPLIGASNFEDVSAEDSYSTNPSTVKRLNISGLPEYRLTFEEGHEFYRELSKFRGFKNYDWILGDEFGNWMVVRNSDGTFGGFSSGHITPELTKRKVKGGDAESKSLLVQFIDRLQWDTNYAILHADSPDIDFIPSDIPGVNGTEMYFDAIPAATDTTIDVVVNLAADNHTPVEGLAETNFEVVVDGVSQVPSQATETDNVYTLTIDPALTAGQIITAKLKGIVNLTGTLYRGKYSAEEEVIA